MVITPQTVVSNAFLEEYNKVANVYAAFNRQNKIGGVNYQKIRQSLRIVYNN